MDQHIDTEYLNPDTLYEEGGEEYGIFTFLYEPELGLQVADGNTAHYQMLREISSELDNQVGDLTDVDPEILRKFLYFDKLFAQFISGEDSFFSRALVGRCGPINLATDWQVRDATLVTFWNDDPSAYASLLPDCMLGLYKKGIITDPVIISTPTWGTKPFSGGETVGMNQDPTPAVGKDELEQMRQLHLMRGDEKKKIMQDLGLSPASQKHPMQSALEKGGHINPGQKWWAPTSESFSRKLNKILGDL